MTCRKCMNEIPNDVDICPICGNSVEKEKNINNSVNNSQIINNSMDEFINEANNKFDQQKSINFGNTIDDLKEENNESMINPQMAMLNDMNNNPIPSQNDEITTKQVLNDKNTESNEVTKSKESFPKIIIWLIIGLILGIVVYFTIYPAIVKTALNNKLAHNWCCQTSNSGSECDMSLVLGDDASFSLSYNNSQYTGKYSVKKSSENIDNDNKSYYTLKLDRFDSNDDFTYSIGTSANKMVIYKNDIISKTLYCSQN